MGEVVQHPALARQRAEEQAELEMIAYEMSRDFPELCSVAGNMVDILVRLQALFHEYRATLPEAFIPAIQATTAVLDYLDEHA